MKNCLEDLGIFEGKPSFNDPLHVGQINLPELARFEQQFRGIFERRYYTNHGPLQQEFEKKLEKFFDVRHAITVTNATIGEMLACKALRLPVQGKVIVPAFTFAASVQALTMAGLQPVFCDVDPATHSISPKKAEQLLQHNEICAILGVHLWGQTCDIDAFEKLSKRYKIPIFYDAAHATGNTYNGTKIGNFGALEFFSFHATKILSTTEGGCICTNDDYLAERLRNIRSSYGTREHLNEPLQGYGRFSEAQAAMGLLSLEDFENNCATNKQRFEQYQQRLNSIPGIRFFSPQNTGQNNYQYVVVEIDADAFGMTRDMLTQILEKENILCRRYFTPGMHKSPPYCTDFPEFVTTLPVTDLLSSQVMQFPSGQQIDIDKINIICDLVHYIHKNASSITQLVRNLL